MKKVLFVLMLLFLWGCGASNMTTYIPPSQQLVSEEFYSIEVPYSKEDTALKLENIVNKITWLKQKERLNYVGRIANASSYVDCGQIITQAPSPIGHNPYASPNLKFMGMGTASADELHTHLDVSLNFNIEQIAEGSKVSINIDYVLHREHIERRSVFGVESKPLAKNSSISFSSQSVGHGGDGVQCRSTFSLEHSIIKQLKQ